MLLIKFCKCLCMLYLYLVGVCSSFEDFKFVSCPKVSVRGAPWIIYRDIRHTIPDAAGCVEFELVWQKKNPERKDKNEGFSLEIASFFQENVGVLYEKYSVLTYNVA